MMEAGRWASFGDASIFGVCDLLRLFWCSITTLATGKHAFFSEKKAAKNSRSSSTTLMQHCNERAGNGYILEVALYELSRRTRHEPAA